MTEAPTPTPSNTADQTKTQLIRLYENYWAAMERAYATGTIKGTDLEKYAAGLALAKAKKDVANVHSAGQEITGDVRVGDSAVTDLDLKKKVPSASLTSCLDISDWIVRKRDTKAEVALPAERLTKYVTRTSLERWPAGWRVVKTEPVEQEC
ncbi:secreted protein/lipoprotein [Streptomyces sp. NPDC056470]|uniref:secreted protein/lipoprotein n=1 Tax=Streptomyces sp. NPDC056470 TaxID=3345831 RepID=UPI0036B3989A